MVSEQNSVRNLTIAQFLELSQNNPRISNFLERELSSSYEEFIDILYKDIDKILRLWMENPELKQTKKEDELTIDLVHSLNLLGYDATHEKKIGGHTDISVKKGVYLWIGEAKIHSNYPYIYKGFQQLTTRYSTGISNQDRAGMLIYIKQPKMFQIIEKWKSYLTEQREDVKIENCKISEDCFVSIHEHERSGKPFYVRHMPISLYFNPQDK